MPIKYNLTKYDILAEKFHDLVPKNGSPLTKDEEILKAEATLIASFASAHSWQTSRAINERNINSNNSQEIKSEHLRAKSDKWKQVKNIDIQEVARNNMGDNLFNAWMQVVNVDKPSREIYRKAFSLFKQHLNEECDGISIQKQQQR